MPNKAFTIRLLIIVAIFVAAGLTYLNRIQSPEIQKNDNRKTDDPLSVLWSGNYTKERAHWKQEIDKLGTEKAYELFKKDAGGKEFGVAHTLSHIFGELIYDKEGVKGVAFCDGSFSFGCYHSFFGKAISENGIDVVPKLADACMKRWGMSLGCPHGIGHGLLGYVGDEKIVDALDICDTLPWKDPFGGCGSGVFMEYNFHTMQSVDKAEDRPFDPKDPYDPCNKLPARFGKTCYFEEPQWWSHVLSADYAKIGRLCSAIKDEVERSACFEGVGNVVAPYTSYDSAKTIKVCSLMPDAEADFLCKMKASWAFSAEPSAHDRASDICKGLSADKQSQCAGGADSQGK
jgi:hypothetical protein